MSDTSKRIADLLPRGTNMILPAEFVGQARIVDGVLDVGGVLIEVDGYRPMDGSTDYEELGVYVRRRSRDMSVIEVALAHHDGLAHEELEAENSLLEVEE